MSLDFLGIGALRAGSRVGARMVVRFSGRWLVHPEPDEGQNCAHLANANKFEHIRHINHVLGLYVPTLTTPLELLKQEM